MQLRHIILLGLMALTSLSPSLSEARTIRHHNPYMDDLQNEGQLVEHHHYVNKSGKVVHSPAHSKSGKAPAGASAKCEDGSYSFSQHHRGTCSHHGGVASWL